MLKRGFKSVSRCLQHFDDDLLAKYYPPELLKSIKCAQTAIPRDTRFRVSHNVEFASAYYDDFSKIDSYWDYKPGMPHLHAQPEELLQNPIYDWQTAIPRDTRFRVSHNVEFASAYYDDFSKIDSYWDYKPGMPHLHAQPEELLQNPIYDWSQVQQPLPGGRVMPPGTSLPTARGRTSKTLDVATGLNRQTGVDVEYITKKLIMKPLVMKRVSNQTAKAVARGPGRTSKTLDVATGLNRQTGVDVEYITKKLIMKPLVMKRVSNQTAKGKIPSFYALVVVGDRNGMVGLGEGKSREEMSKAISKAHWDAIRNLKEIPRYENRTIYSDIDYRYHGVKLHLRSAKPGFGLRVNHVIFEICECAGIKDLSGKVYKSRNEMNIAKGTLEAFTNAQRTLDEIALGRGKRIADVRNVYYSS
ncbi:related to 37S ribosomal protein S5,mitochondrial [Zygosaccharomyces bailii ISA1307]|nr:related to 37S ribosomal protein S5,mitochondrial [Zygosaccharomyces bailii ISA1307]